MKNKILNKYKNIAGLFVFEYIGNHIVSSIPSSYVRYLFYRYILKIHCDSSVYFLMNIYIYSCLGTCCIGKNTTINNRCVLDRRGGLFIGDNVNISPGASIFTGGHSIQNNFDYITRPVVIKDYAWIGSNAMIMPGVTVGYGAVVLPGAIVSKNVDDYAIVGGTPAKQCGIRNKNGLNYMLNWRSYFY